MGSEVHLYGVNWSATVDPLARELECIKRGGRWKTARGTMVGKGLFFHYKRAQELLWPEKFWHRWNELELDCFLKYRTIGTIGPASSGKTNSAATNLLTDYYAFPSCTTILICSTTRERLEDRVWGEIKKYHRSAKSRYPWLSGNLLEARQRIVTDSRGEAAEGRDFRNGVIGVACKKGSDYVGLGDFIGIKNKRVRLMGDELQLLPRVFIDAISNLDKNPDLKVLGLGNCKDTTDALGVLCEPAAHLGGWDGGIDQTGKTKCWETRRPDGICIQLVGSDSPNLDGQMPIPLITQSQIDRDVAMYGKDSLQFTMMNEGRMPRGQSSRRIITRHMCEKFGARDEPAWRDSNRIRIGFLDAAYRGVGGDRCVFGELQFGQEASEDLAAVMVSNLINQSTTTQNRRNIIALIDLIVLPIRPEYTVGKPLNQVEDQIVDLVMNQCQARDITPRNFFYDSGMRTSLVSAFARLWSVDVNPIDCGGTASDRKVSAEIDVLCKDYYQKFITELWYSVRLAVEAGQVRGLTDDVINEGCAREWRMVGANKIEAEPKEEMKRKTGRSPDLFDALAIGFEGARRRGFVIEKLGRNRAVKEDHSWKRELKDQAAALWGKGLNHAA